jgi:AraC-like DNA-binding protein
VDHKIYDIKKGDLILIPKRVIHKTTAIDKNQHTRYLLSFSEAFAVSLCEEMGLPPLDCIFSDVKITVPEARREYILWLLERIAEEDAATESDPYAMRMIRNYLCSLFVFVDRYNKRKPSGAVSEIIPEANIQKAAKYICEHYSEELSLAEVSGHVYMSETYFSKKFKKVTGLNFREYLTSVRIKAADEMLLETEKPIAEIAECCGFSDANYFGDIFKKRKGVSPMQYRKLKGRP